MQEAILSFETAAKRDEGDVFAQSGLAQALLRLHQFEKCEAVLKKLLKYAPDGARDWSALGNVYYQTDRYEEAVSAFTRAIEIAGAIEYHVQRAAALMQLAKPDEALNDLKYVVREDPNGPAMHMVHLMLGMAHYAKDDKANAATNYQLWLDKLLPIDEPEQIHFVLLKLAECTADEKKAKSILERANKLRKD
jgi:tetratricopeptide (TPR) repeat protein